jgi:hypothetical protein
MSSKTRNSTSEKVDLRASYVSACHKFGPSSPIPKLLVSFLFCYVLLLPFSLAYAGLDPETDKPYTLQVVLGIAQHRLLTPVFQDQVLRELRDSLQAAMGDLTNVAVLRDHPLLKEIEARGLQKALDGWNSFSTTKTHFVLVDFVDGRYEIQARQCDGMTGLPSPVVRSAQTLDRQLVAREAALLINQDFGLIGTPREEAKGIKSEGERLDILLKGGKRGVSLARWVKKDDVFAVVQIVQQSSGARLRSYRLPWTFLRVAQEPKDERCFCRLYFRNENPLPSGQGVVGYRCIKLGTTVAPLRLRVVADDRLGTPLAGLQVWFNDDGFSQTPRERTSTKADGVAKTERTYTNLAFVRILRPGVPVAQFPVAILENRTVTCAVAVNPETERRGQLLVRRDRWTRRLDDSLAVSVTAVRELNALLAQSRENALARAQSALKSLQEDILDLLAEQETLRKDAQALKAKPDLTDGEQRLRELQGRREELERFIASLQDIIKDPIRQKWKQLVEQARLHESQFEYPDAIALYESVLSQGVEDDRIRQHVDELKRAWALKNDTTHPKARYFVYDVWVKLTTAAQVQARLNEAREALATCREVGDYLAPQMLLRINALHASNLEKEVESLRPQENEDDRKTVDTILALTEELKRLNDEAREWVRKAKPTLTR